MLSRNEELKEIALVLKNLDENLQQKLNELKLEYFVGPRFYNENYIKEKNKLIHEFKQEEKKIKLRLREIVLPEKNKNKLAIFLKEFEEQMKKINFMLRVSRFKLNYNLEADPLLEYKQTEAVLYNTINTLAKHDLLANIDDFTIELMMRLRKFGQYDLEKVGEVAKEVSDELAEQYKSSKTNRICYEKIVRKAQAIFNMESEDIFGSLLTAFKETSLEFSQHKQLQYTNLYNEKHDFFEKSLTPQFYKKLNNLEQERLKLQDRAVAYLKMKKNPKEFYNIFIRLSMQEMEARRKDALTQTNENYEASKKNRAIILSKLKEELDHVYHEFLKKNNLSSSIINKLNYQEIQNKYYQSATMDGGVQVTINGKSSNEILSKGSPVQPEKDNNISKVKMLIQNFDRQAITKIKLDNYMKLLNTNASAAFERLLKIESNEQILKNLMQKLDNSSDQHYLLLIEERLVQIRQAKVVPITTNFKIFKSKSFSETEVLPSQTEELHHAIMVS